MFCFTKVLAELRKPTRDSFSRNLLPPLWVKWQGGKLIPELSNTYTYRRGLLTLWEVSTMINLTTSQWRIWLYKYLVFLIHHKHTASSCIVQTNRKPESKGISLMQFIKISFLGNRAKWKSGKQICRSKQRIYSTINKLKCTTYWSDWLNAFPPKRIIYSRI